jgi:hypothetical protein
MKKIAIISNLILTFAISAYSQYQYDVTFNKLNDMLKSNSVSLKKAVFETENTFLDGKIDYDKFQNDIEFLKGLCLFHEKFDNLIYKGKDSANVKKFSSVFVSMTDTTTIYFTEEKYVHKPFRYDFDDIFGEKKWENMFVTKLIETKKGNCHSMPYLYKILCDELGVPCWLALAPNHIYIKHRSEKAGMYNTELTSASFPIDAWLMASGYITLEAIQNGIYMDALNDKQCIALCVLDLAKGYEKKYPDNDGTFILKCCDLTMEYIPNCINALLLKAETKKKQIEKLVKQRGITYAVFKMQVDGKIMWEEMRATYEKIHKLGYRTMPEKMYVDWLVSLKAEREKYSNKQVTEMNKD